LWFSLSTQFTGAKQSGQFAGCITTGSISERSTFVAPDKRIDLPPVEWTTQKAAFRPE
jgi:hypothetical protein